MELSDVRISPRRGLAARLPPPVGPGDTVGVAALSGPVRPERLEAGLAALRDLGFAPVVAANLGGRSEEGLFAGDDAERLAAFHGLAADPEVKAIVFARGGWGVNRLLPRLDWGLLARHPRAYVGYSDLTPFLLQVVARLGLVAFHGPMAAADLARGLDAAERASLLGALGGRYPVELELAGGEGRPCRGPLVGGCLSLLTSLLGTPWAAATEGAVLLVEEVDEPLYRFDRMLTHLELSGNLARVEGWVSGHLKGVDGAGEAERHGTSRALALLRQRAATHGASFAWGLEAGHARPNLTVPLGLDAELDPGRRRLLLGGTRHRPRTTADGGDDRGER